MRIRTVADDDVHPWWQLLEHKCKGIVARSGVNNVLVVEDDNQIILYYGGLVEQGRQGRFGRRWLR